MSAAGDADAMLWVILDRIGKHKYPEQVYVGKDYSLAELLEDLRETRRVLEPPTMKKTRRRKRPSLSL